MSTLLRPCPSCGELVETRYCDQCRPRRQTKRTDTGKTAWIKLSRQARRAQAWCLVCGSTRSLECDHAPRAWARLAAGLPLRLVDVQVLCKLCNIAAGPSGENTDRMECWLRHDGDIHGTAPDPSIPQTPPAATGADLTAPQTQGGQPTPDAPRITGEAKSGSQLGMTRNKGVSWQG